jgi:GntR family transcriptional regulator, transcriptional repressor for pyruvate dehydrogenase complex
MPASSQSADPRRLYQQVADQIRTVIEESRFAPGTRPPPEREMALRLGVSRPSLREALIALEIEGVVEIRMGSGVYVCASPEPGSGEAPALGESPSELMQVRSVLEVGIVTQAAARATRRGLERVNATLAAMQRDIRRGHPPIEADRKFHVAIAEMTGNSMMVRLIGELFDSRQSPIASRMSRRAENAATWQTAFQEHEAIYRALELRDPQEATAAMLNHLRASRDRWIERAGGAADADA